MKRRQSISNWLILSLILINWTGMLHAQSPNKWDEMGAAAYEEKAFQQGIDYYKRSLEADDVPETRLKIASGLLEIGRVGEAKEWVASLALKSSTTPGVKLKYAEILFNSGEYEQAEVWLDKYFAAGEELKAGEQLKKKLKFAQELRKSEKLYKINSLSFNSEASEFGPVLYDRGLIFSSNRRRGFVTRSLDLRDNSLFFDLYYAEARGREWEVEVLKGKVNTRFHEGPAIFNAKADQLLFTRSNFEDGKLQAGENGENHLQIFSSTRKGDKWGTVKKLNINQKDYSSGHPSLSKDGDLMVFASDNPAGFGGTDLYLSVLQDGEWSHPVNLGKEINTSGNEMFPYIHPSGQLFFSSEGHPGMGRMDIFFARPSNGTWIEPENAGIPLNSPADDFGVAWVKGRARGYFSSNREGGMGRDDIYTFGRKTKIIGTVVDSRNRKPVSGQEITLLTVAGSRTPMVTDSAGQFYYVGDWGRDYYVFLTLPGGEEVKQKISTRGLGPMDDLEVEIVTEPGLLFSMSGEIIHAGTGKGLAEAKIRLIGEKGEQRLEADEKGNFFLPLDFDSDYTLVFSRRGFRPEVRTLSTKGIEGPKEFKQKISLEPGRDFLVEGRVTLAGSTEPVDAAIVRALWSGDDQEEKSIETGPDGRFWMVLPATRRFYLIGSKEDYFSARVELPAPDAPRNRNEIWVDLELVRSQIGALVKRIYYGYGDADLTVDSKRSLDEIAFFLLENKQASVDLASHTDSRGPAAYNKKLSQKRSEACVEYLISRGIERKRVQATGFGESRLLNQCRDGVECEEEGHQQNRRTEITIVGIDGE